MLAEQLRLPRIGNQIQPIPPLAVTKNVKPGQQVIESKADIHPGGNQGHLWRENRVPVLHEALLDPQPGILHQNQRHEYARNQRSRINNKAEPVYS
jgi:hypothetical protein